MPRIKMLEKMYAYQVTYLADKPGEIGAKLYAKKVHAGNEKDAIVTFNDWFDSCDAFPEGSSCDIKKVELIQGENSYEELSPKMRQRRKLKSRQDASLKMKGFKEAGHTFFDMFDGEKFDSIILPVEPKQTKDEGVVRKKSNGKWGIVGKSGKMWNATYQTKKDAEAGLRAYHANKGEAMNRKLKVEGPGAGYEVTIKDLTITSKPNVTYENGKFYVECDVEYNGDAEGYDWSVSDLYRTLDVERDELYKGKLTFDFKDYDSIWDEYINFNDYDTDEEAYRDFTIDDRANVLKDIFRKGNSFRKFSVGYGGGWSHSSLADTMEVWVDISDDYNPDAMGFGHINADGCINGYLTMDPAFIKDIDFASAHNDLLYKLVNGVKDYVEKQGAVVRSDEWLYDALETWVNPEMDDEYYAEVAQEIASWHDFEDAEGNPIEIK